jgi:O-antigen/teichoic acid export membrane protein
LLWTQSPVTAENTHLLLSILGMGTAFHSLMHIPYALQLASGWTRLAFLVNLVSVLILTPTIIILTKWYGGVGAASVWVILGGGYIVFTIPIMHRRLLTSEKWHWYFIDVGLPFAMALMVAVAYRRIVNIPDSMFALGANIAMVSAITLGATALATPVTRRWLQTRNSTWRRRYSKCRKVQAVKA